MAIINLARNPLRSREVDKFTTDKSIIGWLQEHAPNGFGGPVTVYLNGEKLAMDHWDMPLTNFDTVLVAVSPGAQSVPFIVNILANLVFSYVVNQIFGPDVPRNPGFADPGEANTVYSLSPQQNAAKIGGVIPVIYGEVITTPDYASQPYTEFQKPIRSTTAINTDPYDPLRDPITVGRHPAISYRNDQTGEEQVLIYTQSGYESSKYIEVFGLFRGPISQFSVKLFDVAYGETKVLPALTALQYSFAYRFPVSPIPEYNVTAEFSELTELGPSGTIFPSEYYVMYSEDNRRGSGDQWLNYLLCVGQGKHILDEVYIGNIPVSELNDDEVNYIFLNPDEHKGIFGNVANKFREKYNNQFSFHENVITSLEVGTLEFADIEASPWYPITSENPIEQISVDIAFDNGFYSLSETGQFQRAITTFKIEIDGPNQRSMFVRWDSGKNISAVRRTFDLQVPAGVNYSVRVRRTAASNADEVGRVQDVFRWAGLRGYAGVSASQKLYNDSALLAVRLRASEAISSAAQSRIRAKVRRVTDQIAVLPNKSNSPVTAFVDILTNNEYGAGLSLSSFEYTLALKLHTYWYSALTSFDDWDKSLYGFNAVFNGQSTIYEALQSALAVVGAQPLPVGGRLSIAHEGARDLPFMVFSEANIVQNTFQLSYGFDKAADYDSVRVQYRDSQTWLAEFESYPDSETNRRPLDVQLFGCTNATHAAEYARYTYNKRNLLRRSVSFDTELEGLIPRTGDLIGISHSLPKWSVSGQVVGWDAMSLIVTVDQDLEGYGFSMDTGHLVMRADNGTSTEFIEGTLIGPRQVQLPYAPAFDVFNSLSDTPTLYAWGEVDKTVRLFTIVNLEHRGGNTVALSAIEYNDQAFEGGMTFLEDALP